MGDNLSDGAKIGIILVILCALIAIVFSLLTMMKNITSSGSQSLQNGLDQLTDSEFQNYDQKNVSGTDVSAAIKIFEGRSVGFAVVPEALKEDDGSFDQAYQYGAILEGANKQNAGTDSMNQSAGEFYYIPMKANESGSDKNYNGGGLVKYEGNSYWTGALHLSNSGTLEYNMNVKPMSASGQKSFIRSSAKFLAEIIKDTTGTKIGVVFTQVN